ncbi:MAG TPA: carboxypeptidase regulatory-like domain-containing protein [Terriglobales bacterium]|nr:carboxypeptidase regulatory-like domain-containing protein [Terriglobales bacterium]
MRRHLVACCILALALAWSFNLVAQEVTGTIRGTVADASGAVITGATVSLTNTDKKVVLRTLTTGGSGEYVATLLPIGHYSIAVEAPNFKKIERRDIELNVNDHLTENFTMQPGAASQVVNVEANPLQVQLEDATSAGLINGTQIRELSINNRNYEQLVALEPGVSSGVSDQIYIGVTNPSGLSNQINFSVNGNRPTQNNWIIDGADNVDRGANLTLLTYPSVDSIAEFKVLRGEYNPEFGRSSAGEVNVITRSGTSTFHGGAYEFFRNDVLNANGFFDKRSTPVTPRPKLRYNDFGGTLGGPVYIPGVYNTAKDKTFFFFSEEARRVITYSNFQSAEVPTPAELAGTFPVPVCLNLACSATGTQVSNISPVAQAYVKDIFSKLPFNRLQPDNTFFFTAPNVFNSRQEVYKIDHIFHQRFQLSGRFENDDIPTIEQGGLFTGSNLPGVATTSTNSPGKTLSLRATMSLSTTLLNEVGYAYSYGAVLSHPIGLGASANSPDIKPALPFPAQIARVPNLSFNDGEGIFGFGPYNDLNHNHQVFDNVSKIIGRHSLKFGGTYFYYQKDENDAGGQGFNNGQYSFLDSSNSNIAGPSDGTFQQEFANFLEGNVFQFVQSNQDFHARIRQQQFELYGQDEFRWKPNLTVTYGVRYSYFHAPYDAAGQAATFDPALYNPANAPAIDPTTGLLVAGTTTPVLNGVLIAGKNSPFGNSVNETPKLNFAPRIGLAWDPYGKGMTSIRAGYGIFYDSPAVNSLEQFQFTNPPAVQNITISNTSLDNPASVAPDINLAPEAVGGPAVNWKQPYVQQWSLDFQQDFGHALLGDIGYYGSKGTHLIGVVDINEPLPGAYTSLAGISIPLNSADTQRLNAVRPFKGFDAINIFSPIFGSNYHSLQAQLQKRLGGSSLIVVNYTYSHANTDAQSDFRTPQNTYDIPAEYGSAQFDRRHIFTASYIYDLPFFRSQQGFAGHVLGGWELSGIGYLWSGLPLTATNSSPSRDPAGLGLLDAFSFAGRRPDQVGDANVGAPHTVNQWFNTAAFLKAYPAGQLTPGNARRGSIIGPGQERWDASLFKNTKLSERFGLQFRAEAFNVLNHTNFDSISTSRSSSLFGRVLTARDNRVMQLGLKLNF